MTLLRPSVFARAACCALVTTLAALAGTTAASAQPVEYTLTFPAPQERWMQVEATFPASAGSPLEVRMSRSSPGRYATHEFGKNLYALEAVGADGAALAIEAVRPDVWRVTPTGGSVTVRYRLFGDHIDGTYFAVDDTHAHINAPAVFLWSPSLVDRDARVRLVPPAGKPWRAYTQLFPADRDGTFTAPNLQYLMDSPIEFSAATMREFTVAPLGGEKPANIRVVVHHLGTDAQVEAFTAEVERIVREQRGVFGELAPYDGGTYTFLMDYVPWADGDGMEHRNSTVCTVPFGFDNGMRRHLGTVSHEFFHSWNVERIRPASLEPFDFSQANMSGELWLAEGFTSYYGPLTLRRAGIIDDAQAFGSFGAFAAQATTVPGVALRSAVEMSRLAPFVDAASYIDRTNWENTFLSYYTYGAAIGVGLDLTLRTRTDGRVSLDDFMRALWQQFGKVPGKAPGYVGRPYTIADLQATLATVSGDAAFAEQFFTRHVRGREPIDFVPLFAAAGLTFAPRGDEPYVGGLRLNAGDGKAVVANTTVAGTPVYQAGLHRDDQIVSLGGRAIATQADWDAAVKQGTPGATLPLVFVSRGTERKADLQVVVDPRFALTPVESGGGTLTDAQRTFRTQWLASRQP